LRTSLGRVQCAGRYGNMARSKLGRQNEPRHSPTCARAARALACRRAGAPLRAARLAGGAMQTTTPPSIGYVLNSNGFQYLVQG